MSSGSVLVDVENTLFDAITPTIEHYNAFSTKRFNENPDFSLSDVSDYDFGEISRHYLKKVEAPKEGRRKLFIKGEGDDDWPGYLEHSKMIWENEPGSMEAIGDNLEEGFRALRGKFETIDVVTARSNVDKEILKSRLQDEGIHEGTEYDSFYVKSPKPFGQYDWAVEDPPNAIEQASKNGCNTAKILRPYNGDSEADIRGWGLKAVAKEI